jgi:NAD-dependent deacetylase
MQHLVVFTGAGMSAESGISTFRDSNGLWENHRIEDVATPEGWLRNPALVLEFYNQRRKDIIKAAPNLAHRMLADMESTFKVSIITQNVDNLHERAGSTRVLHLHGEIVKSRSTVAPYQVYPIAGPTLQLGDVCEKGAQLRPHIVWFGESVPDMEYAVELVKQADIFVVIGTSLAVYPAAGLVDMAPAAIPKYYIDPHAAALPWINHLEIIKKTAVKGLPLVRKAIGDKGA